MVERFHSSRQRAVDRPNRHPHRGDVAAPASRSATVHVPEPRHPRRHRAGEVGQIDVLNLELGRIALLAVVSAERGALSNVEGIYTDLV